ncbi:SDR family NAD(P)-dependent oxidoreductase [Rhodococcus sp. IEGM 1381]|uniref:SDR family NAD(P)-dependent oxidoreductase n=1 Tax=Rhodococcus sp. IEGM 1381 TaxID=3047085 RepID=UPI0024B844DC|nr:SDR family NAD(P)-dependent oxidoreductase [Rhodococcus sp. IEGM 1381]MDI9897376.1 SDR family NAD(P)-dependent oxidoreductase [Rhodococcus sp. IEGM 1381]
MTWLGGEVALVTGGGSGIGRAVVDRYVAEGARVVVTDIDSERLDEVRDIHGDTVATIVADVRSYDDCVAAVDLAVDRFGKLDVLVANAGLGDRFAELVDLEPSAIDTAFRQVFDINVKGVIVSVKAALAQLVRTHGSVVVTLSNSSFYPDGGGVIYVASKHAALGVVRQLAHELAPTVRVNGVSPGATETGFTSPSGIGAAGKGPRNPPGVDPNDRAAAVRATTPLDMFAQPSDHTGAYVLAGSRVQSSAMTGSVIETDGGLGVRGLRRVRGGDDLGSRLFD